MRAPAKQRFLPSCMSRYHMDGWMFTRIITYHDHRDVGPYNRMAIVLPNALQLTDAHQW